MALTQKEARKILSNVKPVESFWIHNGPIISNIRHLPKALEAVDYPTFRHHVTKERNDFYNWFVEVIGDEQLAKQIKPIRSKKEFLEVLKKRITFLRKKAV